MEKKRSLTLMLEAYQAITGQEGQHMDELRTLFKCSLVKSKNLDSLERLEQERAFCVSSEKDDALEIVSALHQIIKH